MAAGLPPHSHSVLRQCKWALHSLPARSPRLAQSIVTCYFKRGPLIRGSLGCLAAACCGLFATVSWTRWKPGRRNSVLSVPELANGHIAQDSGEARTRGFALAASRTDQPLA